MIEVPRVVDVVFRPGRDTPLAYGVRVTWPPVEAEGLAALDGLEKTDGRADVELRGPRNASPPKRPDEPKRDRECVREGDCDRKLLRLDRLNLEADDLRLVVRGVVIRCPVDRLERRPKLDLLVRGDREDRDIDVRVRDRLCDRVCDECPRIPWPPPRRPPFDPAKASDKENGADIARSAIPSRQRRNVFMAFLRARPD